MPIRALKGGQFKPLSDGDIRSIHWAVLEVLEEVGVRVEYRPALELFRDHGCNVDFEGRIVKIPEHILRRALSTAPSRFTLCGKTPEYDVRVDTDSVYTIGGSSALYVLDLDGRRREATLQDLADLTRLQDALENLHIIHAIVDPQNIQREAFDRILFSTVVRNTYRNYYSQGQGGQSVRDQVELASIIVGGTEEVRRRPIFTMVTCLISPLVQSRERVEEIMEAAKYGVPLYIEVDAQQGSTTPVTIAGTLVEECANVLCGITLAQLVNPGTPCIFAIASGLMEMQSGGYCGAAPEVALLHAATAQMAHFYNLPFQGGTGIDAKLPDAQAGYERALQVLTCALGGVNFIHLSVGMMDQMLLASYEQCVIDDEILGAAFRIVRGIEVNSETIGLDVLKRVGPGGHFLDQEHTVRHLRREVWIPRLTNRNRWEIWEQQGARDMRSAANERARQILRDHHPKPLTPEQERELDRCLEAQIRRLVQRAG
ncbi:MAG: hypothetical protein HPY71_10380 [Firmicutes bacterium]|nr:hypothetical protein [Bacillota bacterium]